MDRIIGQFNHIVEFVKTVLGDWFVDYAVFRSVTYFAYFLLINVARNEPLKLKIPQKLAWKLLKLFIVDVF